MNILSNIPTAAWTAIGGVLGGVAAAVLSDNQAMTAGEWSEWIAAGALGLGAAALGFKAALAKKK